MKARSESTDEQGMMLWHKFRDGYDLAFDDMYKLYVADLYDYGMRICRENQLVEDCLQNLFMYLWDNRERIFFRTSIRFYLIASLRRDIIRELEKTKKNNGLFSEKDLTFQPSYEQTLIDAESSGAKNEKLKRAIDMLNKRQQEAITLKFSKKMSYDEVASIMSISKTTAYNLVSLAIHSLKDIIKKRL